jgi:hypothetical protein
MPAPTCPATQSRCVDPGTLEALDALAPVVELVKA